MIVPPRTGLARAKGAVKAALDVWPDAKALAYAADDLGRGLRQRLGRIGSESGSTHRALAVEESVGYVEAVFGDYVTYGGLDHLGGTAAEVGPGDNAGVGLLLRAAGCESVELIDRFRSYRSPDQQRRIYQALADRREMPGPPDGAWDDSHLPGIVWRLGLSAEEYFTEQARAGGRRYDLIVSRAALEHLYDPLGALRSMAACLKPGGRMLHKIDFRDHGMFTPAHPELTFLRYPGPLYRRMTRRSGRPNRVLLHRYRDLAAELTRPPAGLTVTILVTSLVGEGEITPHVPFAAVPAAALRRAEERVAAERRRFAAEFAGVSSADLAVTGIFWVAAAPPAR